jgi:hypothetical protein
MSDSTNQLLIVTQTQRITTLNIHLQYQLSHLNHFRRIVRISTENKTDC